MEASVSLVEAGTVDVVSGIVSGSVVREQQCTIPAPDLEMRY